VITLYALMITTTCFYAYSSLFTMVRLRVIYHSGEPAATQQAEWRSGRFVI